MSETKRKRYKKPKHEEKRIVILAKRDVDLVINKPSEDNRPIQPRILLKTRGRNESDGPCATFSSTSIVTHQKNVKDDSILLESDALISSNLTGHLNSETPNSSSAQSQKESVSENLASGPIPLMTRPATVISSTSQINFNASKFLIKNNKDFLVVGVVGRQGVGKSTIMNLLAAEEFDSDTYMSIFNEQESIFPIKIKPNKGAAWPRTESIHMYITKDRMILLDSPPILSNSYKKDELTSEIDDMHNLMIFLTICHLMSEMTKPNQDTKPFVENYFPNILFVKNRAKRSDFLEVERQAQDKMIKFCFAESKLKIFFGETDEQKKLSLSTQDTDGIVNSFLIPEVNDILASSFHTDLKSITEDLRQRVFMTPRNKMYNSSSELTEAIWFELLTRTASEWNHFFFRMYKEARINHYQNGNVSDAH